MITPEQLQEWREATQAATPGPWYTVDHMWLPRGINTYVISGHSDPHIGKSVLDTDDGEWSGEIDTNLEFIATARTAMPALIAEVERLQKKAAYYESLQPLFNYLDATAWEAGGGVPATNWASDLIEKNKALQAENGRLREALRVVKGHIPNSDMFHQAFIMQPENKLYDQYRAEIMHLIAVDFPEALKEVES